MARLIFSRRGKKNLILRVIPINVHFGEKTYISKCGLEYWMSFTNWWMINQTHSQRLPSLLRISLWNFIKNNFKPGDTILSIHITSKLSGTYASAVAAAEELKGDI